MLPSDMNSRIKCGVVGYNNKILISMGLTLGKNDGVNVGAHKDREKHPHTASQPQIDSQAHIDPHHQPHPHIDTHNQPHPHIDPFPQTNLSPHINPFPHTAPSEVTHEEEKIALILSGNCIHSMAHVACQVMPWHKSRKNIKTQSFLSLK